MKHLQKRVIRAVLADTDCSRNHKNINDTIIFSMNMVLKSLLTGHGPKKSIPVDTIGGDGCILFIHY